MNAVLFLLIFCCIFVVMDAIKCYAHEQGKEPVIRPVCKACGYYSLRSADGKETEIQRRCLNSDSMIYGDDSETISELDKCIVKGNTEASVCKTDLCNMDCAERSLIPSSTKRPFSPSSRKTTLPSTSSESLPPSTTTAAKTTKTTQLSKTTLKTTKAPQPSNTPSKATTTTSKTTSTKATTKQAIPQPTTTAPKTSDTENGGNLTADFLSVFGLLLISFFILY